MPAYKRILVVLISVIALSILFTLATEGLRPHRHGASTRTQIINNLKQIGLAVHTYHDVHGKLPPAITLDAKGDPLYSWRVLILPYIDQDQLYDQFHLDEPWDSPNNIKLVQQMPYVFAMPGFRDESTQGLTRFRTFVGPGTALEREGLNILKDFPDGTSETILVIEQDKAVPWTKPDEIVFDAAKPLLPIKGFLEEGFMAVMADGTVRMIPVGIDEATLHALITRNGGEKVTVPD